MDTLRARSSRLTVEAASEKYTSLPLKFPHESHCYSVSCNAYIFFVFFFFFKFLVCLGMKFLNYTLWGSLRFLKYLPLSLWLNLESLIMCSSVFLNVIYHVSACLTATSSFISLHASVVHLLDLWWSPAGPHAVWIRFSSAQTG